MSEHTPGPWIYRKHTFSEYGDVDFCSFGIRGPAGTGGADLHLATVVSDCIEDHEANARLICAAPDLLEALILAREEFMKLPHSLGYEFTHLPSIDAAIARAKGE